MGNQAAKLVPDTASGPDLTLSGSGQVRDGIIRDIAGDADNTEQRRAIKASHEETLRRNQAEKNRPAPADEPLPKPPEDVQSIQIELPDGRTVDLERPPAGTLNLRIALIAGNGPETMSGMFLSIARAMAHITHIDGEPAPVLDSKVELIKLQNLLGEDGVDAVTIAVNETWPPMQRSQLKIVKKTLRTPNSAR